MKYECEVTINLPRERVIELFDSSENIAKWQPTLQSFTHTSGNPGHPGAKSTLVYLERGRNMEMIETITTRDLPDQFSATYEAKGVMNWVHNYFYEKGDQTRWLMKTEFKLSGFMRLIGIFMRGTFPKQTQEMMDNFKNFAEAA